MILVCGEALIDMVPRNDGFYPAPGGSPYNTAIAAARLKTEVSCLGRFSRDFFGEILINHLEKNQVGTDLIVRSNENSTLAFVKLEKGREPGYIFYTEGTADRSLSKDDIPARLPEETRCIAFGSIALTMEPVASAIESLVCREKGRAMISFDPNIRPFMIRDRASYTRRYEQWLAASTIVKISNADIDFLYPGMELENALEKIISAGPRLVLVTLGRDGASALLRGEKGGIMRVIAPVVDLPVADTIGAGDTFHGAFLAWLEMHGKMSSAALSALTETELYNALYFSNKAASIVCSRRGAEPPTLKDIEDLP
ncbi:MAG: carbohydrate kinase [Treponema sp.]|jgi:fructokinase|nr:carbohydrate kinase [Treponema sp.]